MLAKLAPRFVGFVRVVPSDLIDLILTCKCSSVSPFLTVRLVTGTRQGIMILIGSNVGLENNFFWLYG